MSFGCDVFGSKNMRIGSSSPIITSERLLGSSNYLSWAFSVDMWGKGQAAQDYLTNKTVVDIKAKTSEEDAKVKAQWEKVDAQLCSLLWHSIDSKLMP